MTTRICDDLQYKEVTMIHLKSLEKMLKLFETRALKRHLRRLWILTSFQYL